MDQETVVFPEDREQTDNLMARGREYTKKLVETVSPRGILSETQTLMLKFLIKLGPGIWMAGYKTAREDARLGENIAERLRGDQPQGGMPDGTI